MTDSTTNAPEELLPSLRTSTSQQHIGLEAWVNPARRFATREGYTRYLGEIYALFLSYEDALAALPWATIGFDFEERRKSPMIARDLRFFGLPTDASAPRRAFPALDSLAAGFGCLYVLEGSTLGGQMILAGLEMRGISAESGATFFACYGDRTAAMWKAFKESATTWCADDARRGEAVDAAQRTFDFYREGISAL